MLTFDPLQVEEWRGWRQRIASAPPPDKSALLAEVAATVRRSSITMIAAAGQGHVGGDLSVTDILVTLYFAQLRIDPADAELPGRDRFILSKGHCAASFYSTLALCGYFPASALCTFMAPLSSLSGHPDRRKVPGVETNTGALGHGLPVAVGEATASKLLGDQSRVFVATGDGELQEGSNWEALMAAAHHRLDNLTVIVDRNRFQQGASTEDTVALDPLDHKLDAFGLEVRVVDGHDHLALLEAFAPSSRGRPVGVIANTVKGRGVSFMENRVEWHHKVPSGAQVSQALAELEPA
ncbi:MAG: transketolase [Bifidobacteriaceae bacterium]|nr:transketolase [Bifidobacteriaceae bacterium]